LRADCSSSKLVSRRAGAADFVDPSTAPRLLRQRQAACAPITARCSRCRPEAAEVIGAARTRHRGAPFMSARSTSFDGIDCHVSARAIPREDGFESSVKGTRAVAIASGCA